MTPRLSASNLWRAKECPASVVLPEGPKKKYRDATAGNAAHAELAKNAPPGSIPEAAFAYNVLTGLSRFIGSNIGREYGELEEGEIPGSLDLLEVQDDHVLITDWKSGHGFMQAPPRTNLQLGHNALAASTFHGKQRAIVQLVYLKTGVVEDAEYDALDLAAIRSQLRGIWEATRAERPLIQEGAWCWRCPCEKNCPLKEHK